jgi:nucleoid-associated protein EbfC
MFDSIKGLAGLAGIMKDLPKIKARMAQVKDDLAHRTVEGWSGGGAVKVTATGTLKIQSIGLDPAMLSALTSEPSVGAVSQRGFAEDLITEAVNEAIGKAQQMAGRALAEAAEELNLPIPPGVLDGLLT